MSAVQNHVSGSGYHNESHRPCIVMNSNMSLSSGSFLGVTGQVARHSQAFKAIACPCMVKSLESGDQHASFAPLTRKNMIWNGLEWLKTMKDQDFDKSEQARQTKPVCCP